MRALSSTPCIFAAPGSGGVPPELLAAGSFGAAGAAGAAVFVSVRELVFVVDNASEV